MWAADVEGQRLRLIARAPAEYGWVEVRSPRIVYTWGTSEMAGGAQLWVADPETGHRWRLPEAVSLISPSGRYCLAQETEYATVEPVGSAPHGPRQVPISRRESLIGWSPDESTIYFSATGPPPGSEERTWLYAVPAFTGGAPRLIGEYEGRLRFEGISPDGRWLEAQRVPLDVSHYEFAGLVDLQTMELVELGDLRPTSAGWTADGRYVWCVSAFEEGRERFLAAYDLQQRNVPRRITPEDLGGMVPYNAIVSPNSDDVAIFTTRLVEGQRARAWWLARGDGTGLRPTGLAETARVTGWTHDGELVYREGLEVRRLDPRTLQSRTIMTLAEQEPEPPA